MTSIERGHAGVGAEGGTDRVLRASRKAFALITLLLAAAFIFCHGCHAGDHDDELVIHWLDHER